MTSDSMRQFTGPEPLPSDFELLTHKPYVRSLKMYMAHHGYDVPEVFIFEELLDDLVAQAYRNAIVDHSLDTQGELNTIEGLAQELHNLVTALEGLKPSES